MDDQDPATMDPKTLDDDGDDDVVRHSSTSWEKPILIDNLQPLNVVQQKAKLARESSQRAASTSSQPLPPAPNAGPPIDLFDGGPALPVRPSTTDTLGGRPPPPKASAPPKQAKASESLLGMDFFGGPPSTTAARPSSSASTPSGATFPSRPDLKQSILSLYATAPKAQPPPQHLERQSPFGGMQSPPIQQQTSFGGLGDAFSGLDFNPPTSPPAQAPKPQQQARSDPFAGFNNLANQRSSAAPPVTSPPLIGGGFFETGPKLASKPSITSKPPQIPTPKADPLSSNDFGDFSSASSPAPAPSKPAMNNSSNDLFDFTEPSPPARVSQPRAPAPQKPSTAAPFSNVNSAFNLSTPAPPSQPPVKSTPSVQPATMSQSSGFSNMDAWGSSDAWATPEPMTTTSAPKSKPMAPVQAPSITMSSEFSAWGGSSAPSNIQSSNSGNGLSSTSHATPKIAPDEDFGGWSSAAPATPAASNPPLVQNKPASGGSGGFGGSDDLFSNVWE